MLVVGIVGCFSSVTTISSYSTSLSYESDFGYYDYGYTFTSITVYQFTSVVTSQFISETDSYPFDGEQGCINTDRILSCTVHSCRSSCLDWTSATTCLSDPADTSSFYQEYWAYLSQPSIYLTSSTLASTNSFATVAMSITAMSVGMISASPAVRIW